MRGVSDSNNGNGKLDANFPVITKEDCAFSNNARGRFGPASWQKARFAIEGEELETEIKVK